MIPRNDFYVDKHDRLTTDPSKYAAQVATAGVHLDERIAKRYGITDELVSIHEPAARRTVIGAQPEKATEPEPEPEAEEPKSVATKPVAKKDANKGAKKK